MLIRTLGVNLLPAHMIRTTTMMISSPALSWAAWPTSFIVTSSDKIHKHIHMLTKTKRKKTPWVLTHNKFWMLPKNRFWLVQ